MGSILSQCIFPQECKKSQNVKLEGKVIMKFEHAKHMNRKGLVELNRLRGHPNYSFKLEDLVAVDRYKEDVVHVFSYRHQGGCFAPTDGLGHRYLSANFAWALDYLDEIEKDKGIVALGWIDILCTCHDGETLSDAFLYMGELYLNNKVVNNYMATPKEFEEVQKRGWIYQESAFPSIDIRATKWNDEAWSDMSYYRVVADLILRRGFQGQIKPKALNVEACRVKLDEICKDGKAKDNQNRDTQTWWSKVENYKEMICDIDGLGIVLDLHGLHQLANDNKCGIAQDILDELQMFTQDCYKAVVAELKASLSEQAKPSMLGYFAVGAIKAFLSSNLSMESDREAAVFGVLKVLSDYKNLTQKNSNEEESILQYIWTLAYPKGEIIASPVCSASNCTAGLGVVRAIEVESSITPHIPHLRTFVPELTQNEGAKLYVGVKMIEDNEFSIEIYASKSMKVEAIRIIPSSYWNYLEVKARVPKEGVEHHFK